MEPASNPNEAFQALTLMVLPIYSVLTRTQSIATKHTEVRIMDPTQQCLKKHTNSPNLSQMLRPLSPPAKKKGEYVCLSAILKKQCRFKH